MRVFILYPLYFEPGVLSRNKSDILSEYYTEIRRRSARCPADPSSSGIISETDDRTALSNRAQLAIIIERQRIRGSGKRSVRLLSVRVIATHTGANA